jgi:hypothetical protein
LESESGDSARARLIKTRRGTWIDRSLLPAAHQECLEILQKAARKFEDEGIVEMLRGERERLEGSPMLNYVYSWDRRDLMWGALNAFDKKLLSKYELLEEREARKLARHAHQSAGLCGSCGRELSPEEPAYFGAQVYAGMELLRWNRIDKPRICEPRYVRTVLCGSCAPEWLSSDSDDVTTQLCAHCERPMVRRLKLSELNRMFCADPCKRAYRNRLREEKRAEERKQVCEVCDEEFFTTRPDVAKTCSNACKQKAYRQRKREVDQNH